MSPHQFFKAARYQKSSTRNVKLSLFAYYSEFQILLVKLVVQIDLWYFFFFLPWHAGGIVLMAHFLRRSWTLDDLVAKMGIWDLNLQTHSRSAAWRIMQHSIPGGGGLFPVTAGRHFSNVFALMLHTGILVGSSIKTRATKTITRAASLLQWFWYCSYPFFLWSSSLLTLVLPWNQGRTQEGVRCGMCPTLIFIFLPVINLNFM